MSKLIRGIFKKLLEMKSVMAMFEGIVEANRLGLARAILTKMAAVLMKKKTTPVARSPQIGRFLFFPFN